MKMNSDGWLCRQLRRLWRRRVLVTCCVLSCLIVVQLLTWWISDRWLDDGQRLNQRVSGPQPAQSRRCRRLGALSAVWLDMLCRYRTSQIPVRTQLKQREDDINADKNLLSSRASTAVVVRTSIRVDTTSCNQKNGILPDLTCHIQNRSSTSISARNVSSSTTSSHGVYQDAAVWRRHLLAVANSNTTVSHSNLVDNISSVVDENFNCTASNAAVGKSYPTDLFTEAQLYHGAVVLHATGTFYMFIGLAIVCDEYFIPALEVITAKFGISEDVAGATLMAAGGSAPELFTSFIGVFVARSNVGIGTIVGSAVFNIVFVIGACSLASARALTLTWWPLCRDMVFYCVSLLCLIGCFADQLIHWWEAAALLLCYFSYVAFMAHNRTIERMVKNVLNRKRIASSCDLAYIMQVRSIVRRHRL